MAERVAHACMFHFTSKQNQNFPPNRILALEKLGAVFNQVSWPLQYTPRRFVIHPESSNLITIETDHNAYTEETKQQRKQQMAEVCWAKFSTKAFPLSVCFYCS